MIAWRYAFYFAVAVAAVSVFQVVSGREDRQSAEVGDQVALGRRIYISEGCIHCHSQYVRPVGQDQALWGAPTTVEQVLGQEPVLIGNRRQGPDLAHVGDRRNAGWNRLHLIEPSAVVPGSRMPSYRHLFERGTTEGEALLAYLDSLRAVSINAGKGASAAHNPEGEI